ncbi:MAG: fibronectin type III domain-containing protein [Clostridia bacterium]|nr:fibronectin type III domain-containing protein [Clostridia bacterium]
MAFVQKKTKLTTTKGKANITWSNVADESGYQLYYSTSKNGTYKKVASYDKNMTVGSKTKLVSGKKYYFKVRAYKVTASDKIYSSWSSVKSVKIK